MSPVNTIQTVKRNINRTNYNDDLWFRWKTPDKFICNNRKYELEENEKQELRTLIGDLIRIYLNSVGCENEE